MVNPYHLKKDDLPLIVLSDHSSGFIQWAIKWRTKANYNHIMSIVWPGEFVSQGNRFSAVPFDRYMTKRSRLKFWRIKDLTRDEKTLIKTRVLARLDRKRSIWNIFFDYDYLGIVGQATGLKFINNPYRTYCVEQVVEDILTDVIDFEYEKDGELVKLQKYPAPVDTNIFFDGHPRMEMVGRWAGD